MKEVIFIKSPTGLLLLGNHIGDTVKLSDEQAKIAVDAKIARYTSDIKADEAAKKETADKRNNAETADKK